MRIWLNTIHFLDMIEEEVACATGILLSQSDMYRLTDGSEMQGWRTLLKRPLDAQMGIRPEMIEDFVRVLRAAVGNLPDAEPGDLVTIRLFKKWQDEGIDPSPMITALNVIVNSGKYTVIGREAAEEIAKASGFDLGIVAQFLGAMSAQMDRHLKLFFKQQIRQWDGAVPLSVLFEGEHVPEDPERFLDQRFIDFLAVNEGELDKMHWRNFERLAAEFFKRLGYVVLLGPGSKDGGIDLRIWPAGKKGQGPPLLLIQCKRLKKTKTVRIESVKAFWTDVQFEGAAGGLIATTSRVTQGSKRLCEARGYPLSFAENETVTNWAGSMWRFPYTRKRPKSGHVGVYLIPPVYFA